MASIEQVYEELKKIERNMITKKEMGLLMDTISITNNPETIKQIFDSLEDIKSSRVKEVSSVRDLMNEM
ncbi:MAG: hypothetical protein AABX29_04095 [Nanoarchaeota archaeon]